MKIYAGHDAGGCGYWRIIVPLTELSRHGHDVTIAKASDLTYEFDEKEAVKAQVIVGQRWNSEGSKRAWRRMAMRGKLVFELDDDIFNIDPANFGPWRMYGDPLVRDTIAHCMEISDLVTVTTPVLAEVMSKHNPKTAVLPNVIPDFVLDLPKKPLERLTFGWMGGASHGMDILLIASPVKRFLSRNPDCDAVLIGTDYRSVVKHERCGFDGWIQINDDPEGYFSRINFDVGLCPLTDTVFNRSKSPLKALEYMARGMPVIASDVTPYKEFVTHGETGFLVRYEHEWIKYMEELANDRSLFARMSEAAKEFASEWTIGRHWRQWEEAYEGLL